VCASIFICVGLFSFLWVAFDTLGEPQVGKNLGIDYSSDHDFFIEGLFNDFSTKMGLGISRTNADSQWNSVYNAFHRFFLNETNRR